MLDVDKIQAARKEAKRLERIKLNQEAARANEEHRRNKGLSRKRFNARVILPIRDGCVFVLSDQHYDPEAPESPAHQAAVKLARDLKPYAVINNGDTIDGASISRWPVGSFSELGERPSVEAEIGVASKRLREFERMKFVQYLIWNLGNHDARFETRLAEKVPEYADVLGFTLKDHFPGWLPAWRTDVAVSQIATPEVIIKHRFKGGVYAARNNALHTGTSTVTGHLHRLYAMPITNVRGTHWGIEAGTLSPIDARPFTNYTEDNVQDWQSGFAILHFRNGKFTGPELVHAVPDGRVLFRGNVLK